MLSEHDKKTVVKFLRVNINFQSVKILRVRKVTKYKRQNIVLTIGHKKVFEGERNVKNERERERDRERERERERE